MHSLSQQPRTTPTPLPKRQIAILCCVAFSEPVSLFILFPFVSFMVKDFNLTPDSNEIGYYVGYIASSFSLAQMLSGLSWGWLSDRWGRRPVLLLGLIGNTICGSLFGLSKSLHWAIISRSLCGLLNGNSGVAKSVLSEITDSTNEGMAFSLYGIIYGLGSTIGPVLGGFLSHPADQFPSIFGKIEFLREYPYFLPCFLGSFVGTIGFIIGYFFFEETLNVKTKPTTNHNSNSEMTITQSDCRNYGSTTTRRDRSFSNTSVMSRSMLRLYDHMENRKHSVISWKTISCILPYTSICFLQVVFDEVYSLWSLAQPKDGGLNFTSRDIGLSLSFLGVSALVIQLVVYHRIQSKYGSVVCYRWAMLLYASVFFILPNLSAIAVQVEQGAYSRGWLWVALLSVLFIRINAGVFAFTSGTLFISTAGKRVNALGVVNGLSQCFSAIARTIGPALGGTLWSWSLTRGLPYPFDYRLVFNILGITAFLSFGATFYVEKYLTPSKMMEEDEETIPIIKCE